MLDFCTRTIFANHQHDGVIAGNGTDDFMEIVHVNVVCQAAGISRTSLDDSDVVGEFNGDEAVVTQHFAGFCGSVMRLYMVLLGSTYT